jgi:hypothetical protein
MAVIGQRGGRPKTAPVDFLPRPGDCYWLARGLASHFAIKCSNNPARIAPLRSTRG